MLCINKRLYWCCGSNWRDRSNWTNWCNRSNRTGCTDGRRHRQCNHAAIPCRCRTGCVRQQQLYSGNRHCAHTGRSHCRTEYPRHVYCQLLWYSNRHHRRRLSAYCTCRIIPGRPCTYQFCGRGNSQRSRCKRRHRRRRPGSCKPGLQSALSAQRKCQHHLDGRPVEHRTAHLTASP